MRGQAEAILMQLPVLTPLRDSVTTGKNRSAVGLRPGFKSSCSYCSGASIRSQKMGMPTKSSSQDHVKCPEQGLTQASTQLICTVAGVGQRRWGSAVLVIAIQGWALTSQAVRLLELRNLPGCCSSHSPPRLQLTRTLACSGAFGIHPHLSRGSKRSYR